MHYIIGPAYGRDYKNRIDAEAAFVSGSDFRNYTTVLRGKYMSVNNVKEGDTVEIRFCKLLRATLMTGEQAIKLRNAQPLSHKPVKKVMHYDAGLGFIDSENECILDLFGWIDIPRGQEPVLDYLVNTFSEPSARWRPELFALVVMAFEAFQQREYATGQDLGQLVRRYLT